MFVSNFNWVCGTQEDIIRQFLGEGGHRTTSFRLTPDGRLGGCSTQRRLPRWGTFTAVSGCVSAMGVGGVGSAPNLALDGACVEVMRDWDSVNRGGDSRDING